jgi:hypothetical protein
LSKWDGLHHALTSARVDLVLPACARADDHRIALVATSGVTRTLRTEAGLSLMSAVRFYANLTIENSSRHQIVTTIAIPPAH